MNGIILQLTMGICYFGTKWENSDDSIPRDGWEMAALAIGLGGQ